MTPEQFAYWLQGFVEVHGEPPNAKQWQIIRDHLATVFHTVTPDRSKSDQAFPKFDRHVIDHPTKIC